MNSAPIPAPLSNARPPTQNRVLAGAVADRPGCHIDQLVSAATC
jgi:hypothetical protein